MTDSNRYFQDSHQEKAARALLATLYPDSYSERWDVTVDVRGISFCDGSHDKGDPCHHDILSIRRTKANVYRHKKRGTLYQDLGVGNLQIEEGTVLEDGNMLKVYIDEENRLWFRTPSEFHDGRFEKVSEKFSVTSGNNDSSVPQVVYLDPTPKIDGSSTEYVTTKVELTGNLNLGTIALAGGNSTFSLDHFPNFKSNEELQKKVQEALDRLRALPPEEQEKMWDAQRKSFSSGPHGPTDDMGTVYIHTAVPIQSGGTGALGVGDVIKTYADLNGSSPDDDLREELLNAMWRAHRRFVNPHFTGGEELKIPKDRTDLRSYYSIYLDAILRVYGNRSNQRST